MSGHDDPFVSVIVPVYNDAERLKLCLEALEAQSYPSDGYEVIVVDNGSDKSPDLVVALFPHATLAFQPKAGSYAARNMGLSVANGQFLAFTDADCIATPQWLRCGVNRMLELNGKGLVAGYIRLFYKKPKRPGWVELCDLATAFDQRSCSEEHGFAATGNAFTHRCVFDAVGLFNENLKSKGDVEWGKRARAAGVPVVYCPQAIIDHPARSTLREISRKKRRLAGGDLDWLDNVGPSKRSIGLLGHLWNNFVPHPYRIWKRTDDERLTRLRDRCKVTAVLLVTQYVEAWEKVRIRLGGWSQRG